MPRILFVLVLLASLNDAYACEKKLNPTTDCWNPSSKYTDEGLRRFYSISTEIDKALFENDLDKATTLANEYLELSKRYSKNWNYGNAVHDSNIALGIIELRKDNIKKAGSYLVAAGASSGSPQLDSFGPDLTLANVLLEKGEVDSVLKYLYQIRNFWKMDRGKVEKWIAEIEHGKKPKLSRFPP